MIKQRGCDGPVLLQVKALRTLGNVARIGHSFWFGSAQYENRRGQLGNHQATRKTASPESAAVDHIDVITLKVRESGLADTRKDQNSKLIKMNQNRSHL